MTEILDESKVMLMFTYNIQIWNIIDCLIFYFMLVESFNPLIVNRRAVFSTISLC